MHLPDAVLSLPVVAGTSLISLAALIWSCIKIPKQPRYFFELACMAMGLFLIQLLALDFSWQFLGAALAGIVLGPFRGVLVVAMMIGFHCLVGRFSWIHAGPQIFNEAMSVWTGWAVYHLCGGFKRPMLSAIVAGWVCVALVWTAYGLELFFSGAEVDVNWSHLLLPGIFEGGATAIAVALKRLLTPAPFFNGDVICPTRN